MNPLVKDMLEATISNEVETRFLEDLFEDEAKCQAREHKAPCTQEVTHAYRYCQGGRLVCTSRANEISKEILAARNGVCRFCHEEPEKCWTIRPI